MESEVIGVLSGCLAVLLLYFAWLIGRAGQKKMIGLLNDQLSQEKAEQKNSSVLAQTQAEGLLQKNEELRLARKKEIQAEKITSDMGARLQLLTEREKKLAALPDKVQQLSIALAESQSQLASANEKLRHEAQTETVMNKNFENLANRIFDDKSNKFSVQNKESLTHLLTPFREQIDTFKKQVEAAYNEENKERRSLQNEVKSLKDLNQSLAEEAVNLTRALKGDKKLQGNWGEMVLDRVLDESGLREGHEYNKQVSLSTAEGERQQPDVIVHLPDNKDVIVDAKVSLIDYSRYHEATDESKRSQALKNHVKAIQNHIKGLSEKNYQALEGVKTLDYVLMFIPIEPAFYAAIEHQPTLFQEALDKNIMLVSPTNLLVALKTIHHIWRYERQNRNTQDIARKAGAIYDKLRGITDDMLKLGSQMNTAKSTYDDVLDRFKHGKGNLLKQAHDFVELGVKVKKEFNPALMDEALANSAPTNKPL